MQAHAMSVLSIFGTKARYEVPLFQRQYIWNRSDQWEPLWEDISRKFSDYLTGDRDRPVHFLGAMVLDQKQTPTGHVDRRQVIDGQQRLTTLQIFLAAFRDYCRESDCVELADECTGYLFNAGMMATADEKFKVWPTQTDRVQFKNVIEAGSRRELDSRYPFTKKPYARKYDPRPSMVEAYGFFYEAMREFFEDRLANTEAPLSSQLEECFTALKGALQVVVMDLEKDDDPQVIFETLNARGAPLLPADLLRNYIFLRAARQGDNQEELYDRFWRELDDEFWRVEVRQGRLTRPRSDIFMQHFLASQTGGDVAVKHLFVEYKHWIQAHQPFNTVREELTVIQQYSQNFRRIVSPKMGDVLTRLFAVLEAYDISTAYPLLLLLLDRRADDAALQTIADTLESYIVRRAVCGYTTKAYNRIFLGAVRTLRDTDRSVDALLEYLRSLRGETAEWPDDQAFHAAWSSNPLYTTLPGGRVVYILQRLNDAAMAARSERIVINTPLTVEHIMPRRWAPHWPLPDGSAGVDDYNVWALPADDPIRVASERRSRLVESIGNLTVLSHGLNSEVSNSGWSQKKHRILEVSLLPINQRLHAFDIWDEEAILKRAEGLFALALEIWKSPDCDATHSTQSGAAEY